MGKTRELARNTVIFAIGTIGSKLMHFLLVPIFTLFLSSSEYSAADLIVSTVFLLSPLLTIGIGSGILRFVLDRPQNRGKVLKLCVYITLVGTFFLIIFIPFLNSLEIFSGYGYYVPIIFFCYSLKHILANYCKAIEKNLLYSVDGILSASILTLFSILFLGVENMGIKGYVWATIASLIFSIILFFVKCDVFSELRKSRIDTNLSKEVIKYAFPLMPNELSWWFVQMSNRYILVYFCGASVNGIFSMSYKLPGIFNLIVSVFIQAFGITAIKECNLQSSVEDKIDGAYFSKIYEKYCAITFISVVAVILVSKPLAFLFFKNDFVEAWRYVPFLLCAYAIGNLQAFYGSILGGAKKTKSIMISTLFGAVVCILANFIFIPFYGAFGACIAAILGYIVIYVIRLISSKKNVEMSHFSIKNALSVVLVVGVSVSYVCEMYLICISLCSCMFIMYFKICTEMIKLAKKGFRND